MIKTAEFALSYASKKDYPATDCQEIAVVGKSNVGKSSMINSLCNRNKLARTSSSPGKTRLVNFYLINGQYYLVDLPGYGYARVSKEEQSSWQKMIEGYLEISKHLAHALLLVDIRHDPTEGDKTMADYFRYFKIPFTVVATKADKIAKSKQKIRTDDIRKKLGQETGEQVISYSTLDKTGREDLWALLDSVALGSKKIKINVKEGIDRESGIHDNKLVLEDDMCI
ncbi:MAG: ribosome biogenesis GTP-binding protein YihA/YsxC [Christensenellales bacterium]